VVLLGCQQQGVAPLRSEPGVAYLGELNPEVTPDIGCSFTIRNDSGQDVHSVEVVTGCGCLVPDPFPAILKADAEQSLGVRLRVPEYAGPFTKVVLVKYDQGEPLRLSISGTVLPCGKLSASPNRLDFGECAPSETKSRTFDVLRMDRAQIQGIQAISDQASVVIREVESATSATTRLEAEFKASQATRGRIAGTILVTASNSASQLTIPFTAVVNDPSDSTFVRSLFTKQDPNGAPVRLRLSRPGVSAPRVRDYVYEGPDDLQVKVVEIDGESYASIAMIEASHPRLLEGRLKLILDGSTDESYSIPIRVLLTAHSNGSP